MPFEWPQARELTDAEKGTIGYALKGFGLAVDKVEALVVPALSLDEDVRPRFVGRVYLLEVRSTPVALARNAYSRHFPAVEGPTSAEHFAAQLRELQKYQDAESSPELLRPVYLASPLTSTYCAAAVGTPLTNLRWVADSAGNVRVPRVRTAQEFLLEIRERLRQRFEAQQLAPPGNTPTN